MDVAGAVVLLLHHIFVRLLEHLLAKPDNFHRIAENLKIDSITEN